jgi:poly-gamma-glutamate synthesis protein (capsule biosynthesis protein)
MLYPVVIGGDTALTDDLLERRLAPYLATGASAERILRRLAKQSAELGANIEISGDVGFLRV